MALTKIPANMVSIVGGNEVTESASDPTVSTNPAGGLGTLWLNTTSGEMYCCTDATVGANIWTNIGAGTGDFAPYTGLVATGGTITTDGDYKVHTFNESGTFTVSNPGTDAEVEYLVIAGGGGGCRRSTAGGDGGGGAGGYRTTTGFSVSAQAYTVTVGAGGAGQTGANGSNGSNSEFGAIASTGGGGGGWNTLTAGHGGSGGGTGYVAGPGWAWSDPSTRGLGNTGSYTPVEGYNGGLGQHYNGPHGISGGGGGGAGGVGQDGHGTPNHATGGDGGVGRSSSITGTAVMRAGGGGGGGDTRTSGPGGAGGNGGGGTGGGSGTTPTSGTVNTGGGGGGVGSGTSGSVMNGGSGTVIIRYKFQ